MPGYGHLVPRVRRGMKMLSGHVYRRLFKARWRCDGRLKVLIEEGAGFSSVEWLQSLDHEFSGWQRGAEVRFVDSRLRRQALALDMDVYVGSGLAPDLAGSATALKWIHLTLAGVDSLGGVGLPARVIVTTSAGISASGVAEHVAGLLIALDRRLDLAILRQLQWKWGQIGIVDCMRGLKGRTVGIVGLGHNGRAVALVAGLLGMRVIGLDRNSDLVIGGLEALYAPDRLLDLLHESDFVVLCVPLTRETRGLIGRAELEALGSESYLVNVARGQVVDESALAWALRNGVIAGAAVDVMSVEPPPRSHPLRGCPNLIVTPHVAGNMYTFRDAIRSRFVRNLRAFLEGKELEGLYNRI